MNEWKCYHVELRRTVDVTVGGAMVFRCAAKECGKAFAVAVIEENSPEPQQITIALGEILFRVDGSK
jgi:hypothetical protein